MKYVNLGTKLRGVNVFPRSSMLEKLIVSIPFIMIMGLGIANAIFVELVLLFIICMPPGPLLFYKHVIVMCIGLTFH